MPGLQLKYEFISCAVDSNSEIQGSLGKQPD